MNSNFYNIQYIIYTSFYIFNLIQFSRKHYSNVQAMRISCLNNIFPKLKDISAYLAAI